MKAISALQRAARNGKIESAVAIAFLAGVACIAHFWNLADFGIYEDDTRSAAPYLGKPFSTVWQQCSAALSRWPQGRPLNHCLPEFLAWAGSTLAGGRLWGAYLVGWLVLAINAALVRALARQFVGRAAAFVGAATYLLVPFDTTRQFLTHSGHLHTSITLFLLAALLYCRGGLARGLSYLVAAVCLITYESPYLLYAFFPVLLFSVRKIGFKEIGIHGVVCVVTIGSFAAWRILRGESRVEASVDDPATTLWQIVSSLYLGPATSLSRMAGFILDVAPFSPPVLAAIFAVAGCVLLGLVGSSRHTEEPPRILCWLLLACLGWLAFSYGLSLVAYPPTQIFGRRTSLHLSASIPAALVVACLYQAALQKWAPARRLLAIVAAAYLGLLGGFHYRVQMGYVEAWAGAKVFWKKVIASCPDMDAKTTIFVSGPIWTNPSKVIKSFGISNQRFLPSLFEGSKTSPCLIWLRLLDRKDGFDSMPADDSQPGKMSVGKLKFHVTPGNVIVLKSENGNLVRLEAVTLKSGETLRSKRRVGNSLPLAGHETAMFRLVTGAGSLAEFLSDPD